MTRQQVETLAAAAQTFLSDKDQLWKQRTDCLLVLAKVQQAAGLTKHTFSILAQAQGVLHHVNP